MDPRFARDDKHFYVSFPAEHKELKKVVTDFQLAMWLGGCHTLNVTAFCLPDVLAVIAGELYVAGLPVGHIEDEKMDKKLSTFSDMDWPACASKAKEGGFVAKVSTR